MEFLSAIATSIVAKIAEYTVKPVCRQLGYLFFYNSNVDNLRSQIQELGYARDRLQHRIEEDRRNGEVIEADVENWLNKVDRIKEESESFLQNEDHAKTRCSSNGSFLNLVSRHQLSRKAKKKVQDVISEINKAEKFVTVCYRPCIHNSVANKGYEVFESRVQTLTEIIEALKDSNVRMIGMYGMGGVGKTMLAKEVARMAKEENLSDKVVITTVSQTPDVENIQQDIAEQVGLEKFHEIESRIVRAERLRHRLSQEKKILVILDDIWNELDLSAVGIDFDDHQKGCKILLTSRFLNVLQDLMAAERNIEIKVLLNIEAMNLFKKNAGVFSQSVDFQPLVKDIVMECAGLPIAITTVARALKNKSLSIWEDALLQLKRSILTNIEGMDQKVYASIKLSYDFLGSDEEAKSLLLLCSLHEEVASVEIKDLMIYGVGLGLFREVYALEEARNRVDSLVNKLKDRCLLLDGYYDGAVKMHDVTRDVMISIASEDRQMYNVPNVDKFEDFFSKKRLTDSTAISICVRQDTNNLPDRLDCPQLKLLLMFNRSQVGLAIPEQYFEEKKELKVLRLNRVNVDLLPTSFRLPQNLQALCLYSCTGNISLISELKHLKILDLSRSTIEELPKHIGQLKNLQLLNLEYCRCLKVIQPGVISSLKRLEELNMRGVTIEWDDKGANGESINASLVELKNLPQLATLYLSIQNANILPKGLFSENLKRYELFIGKITYDKYDEDQVELKHVDLNSLYLELSRRNLLEKCGLEMIMKRSEVLYLRGLKGLNNIVHELDPEGFHQLKSLEFHDNDEIRYVVDSSSIQPCSAFLSLERLCLVKLMNLEQIFYGRLTKESFGKLRSISIRKCDRLKNLFSSSIAGQFEEIEVINCKTVKEIFTQRTDDETNSAIDKIVCTQLRSLNLKDLPEYIQFFRSELEATDTSSSDSPLPLFSEKVAFPGLKRLTLTSMKFNVLYSDQLPTTVHSLQNLTSLSVNNCHGLKHLFPFSMARSLEHLKVLKIDGCGIMEEVLIREEGVEGRLDKISFPKLKFLWLLNLPKLEKFCIGDFIEFPTLSSLRIENCPRLSTFVIDSTSKEIKSTANQSLFSDKVAFPGLKELTLSSMKFNVLYSDQLPTTFHSLQNLTSLSVNNYHGLKHLLPFSMARNLEHLEVLKIDGCGIMEEVLIREEGVEGRLDKISFPKLKSLWLLNLPKLEKFCIGDFIEFPTLSSLRIKNCPRLSTFVIDSTSKEIKSTANQSLFSEKVAFPGLKELRLTSMKFDVLYSDQLPTTFQSLQNLASLSVNNCNGLKHLLPFSMARSLVHLEDLYITGCGIMEEVLITEEGVEGRLEKISFPKLKSLWLQDLPKLEKFCVGDIIEFPTLSSLRIQNCPRLKSTSNQSLFSETVAFPGLKELRLTSMKFDVLYSDQLPTTFHSLQNLTSLSVNKCHGLKHLLPFSMARSLVHLEVLKIDGCGIMEEVLIREEGVEGRLDKISFPKLKSLWLLNLPKLEKVCIGDFIEFPRLSSLRIENCPRLSTFVIDSTSKEIKSTANQSLFSDKVAFPVLKKLTLTSMKLNVLCSDQLPTTVHSLQNLTSLSVKNCHGLKHLLPFSMARSLEHLEVLKIDGCGIMEEVLIREEGVEGRLDKISFPKLKSLWLLNLPKLEKFCIGDFIEFPRLSSLRIENCPRLSTFIIDSTSKEIKSTSNQSLFSEKALFPNLECLVMDGREVVNEVWHRQSSAAPFCTLKDLTLTYDDKKSVVFSFKFIQRFQNLERLSLTGDSVEQICQQQEANASEESDSPLPRLKVLKLSDLRNLRCLLENLENAKSGKAFKTTEAIEVRNCPSLMRLVPCLQAFTNLKDLRVSSCRRLINLLASSTVKCLVQLTRMSIEDCKELREIVLSKDDTEDEIAFSRLRILVLHDLPNLESFYSGNATMRFPILNKLILSQCPSMQIFSRGIITTQTLNRIILGIVNKRIWRQRGEGYMDSIEYYSIPEKQIWEGDINSTVRKIWEDDPIIMLQEFLNEV